MSIERGYSLASLGIICRTSFRKCKFTLLTRNIAHAEFKCGRNIEKNTWWKYTLPYSSPEPYYATSVRVFARYAASERQATSQWKSIHERGAETPEETETRNGSSAIRHFERDDEDLTE